MTPKIWRIKIITFVVTIAWHLNDPMSQPHEILQNAIVATIVTTMLTIHISLVVMLVIPFLVLTITANLTTKFNEKAYVY